VAWTCAFCGETFRKFGAALCQRCHLRHDRKHHLAVQAANRHAAMRTGDLFGLGTVEELSDRASLTTV
jgi:hypothetical protein